jgi:CHAD domain-containing protein
VEWDETAAIADNARSALPPMVSRFFNKVREFLANDHSPAELHQLRLATKRLRYALELFRPCYGPGLETRMAELHELQQLLGDVNDSATASQMLAKAMRESPQRTRVAKFLEERSAAKAQKFRKHWIEVFDAAGRERWWTLYLERQARPPSGALGAVRKSR